MNRVRTNGETLRSCTWSFSTVGRSACVGLVVAMAGPLASATDTGAYRFWKEIQHAAGQEEILAVVLDSQVYASTRDGVPDLRIMDDAGTEVPYEKETVADIRETRVRHAMPSEVVALREEENSIEVHLRLDKVQPRADGISFHTPLTDYEHLVSVHGSRDGAHWEPLVTDGVIFDYRRYMDVRNLDVMFPVNEFHEFKVVIRQVVDERESPFLELAKDFRNGQEDRRVQRTMIERRPFRIDRVEFLHYSTEPRQGAFQETDYPAASFRVERDAKRKQTVVHVKTRREPLTSLVLETSSRNFHRVAVVQAPATPASDPADWIEMGQGTLAKLDFRGVQQADLTVRFPEHQSTDYRIAIQDDDNPPLEVIGVVGKGPVHRAVFLASPGKSYRAFYGSEVAEPPTYESSTVLNSLRRETGPIAAPLGEEVENHSFGGEKEGMPIMRLLSHWAFLGSAIAITAVVLGWAVFRAVEKVEEEE